MTRSPSRRFGWRTRLLVKLWRDIDTVTPYPYGVSYRFVILFTFLAGVLNLTMVVLHLALLLGLWWWS